MSHPTPSTKSAEALPEDAIIATLENMSHGLCNAPAMEIEAGKLAAQLRAILADRTARAAAPQALTPMPDEQGKVSEWYFDDAGTRQYIDVKRDASGKYSVFLRDRNSGTEAWIDQAAAPVQSVDTPELRAILGSSVSFHGKTWQALIAHIDSLLAARPSAAPVDSPAAEVVDLPRADDFRYCTECGSHGFMHSAKTGVCPNGGLSSYTPSAAQVAVPRLVLALPDWEDRTIMIASDETIDGERLVCVSIKDVLPAPSQAEPEPEESLADIVQEYYAERTVRIEPAQAEPVSPVGTGHKAWMRPVYYTDTINNVQVCRDDLWAITTQELQALIATPPAATAPDMGRSTGIDTPEQASAKNEAARNMLERMAAPDMSARDATTSELAIRVDVHDAAIDKAAIVASAWGGTPRAIAAIRALRSQPAQKEGE